MKLKDALTAAAVLAIVATLAFFWLAPAGLQRAPDLSLETSDGRTVNLASAGGPVLVTFWATTCSTCVKEIPHLSELYRELHPKGLEIIGVSMYYDPPLQVMEMVKRRNIPYPVAFDVEKKALQAFDMRRAITPTSYLIAPNGRVVLHKTGMLDMDRLRARITSMLEEA